MSICRSETACRQPVVLVGPNGSGKSTLLSFIVNALVGFKQHAFEQAEVEQGRVYRVRSGMFIRWGTHWYHAKLEFEEGLSLDEWMLDRPRKEFEATVTPLPAEAGWREIQEGESERFLLTPQQQLHFPQRVPSKLIQKLFGENVVLFFPSDRFELPDWLNEQLAGGGIAISGAGQVPRADRAKDLLPRPVEADS